MKRLYRLIPKPRGVFLGLFMGSCVGFVVLVYWEKTRYNVIADLLSLFGIGWLIWFVQEAHSDARQDRAWLRGNASYVAGVLEGIVSYCSVAVDIAVTAGYALTDEQTFRVYRIRLGRTRKDIESSVEYAQLLLDAYNQNADRHAELHPSHIYMLKMYLEAMQQFLIVNSDIASHDTPLTLLVRQWIAVAEALVRPQELAREERQRYNLAEPTIMTAIYLHKLGDISLHICRNCSEVLFDIDAYPLEPL